MSPRSQVTNVSAAGAVQSLSYMRRTGMASSAPHGNGKWTSKPSDTSFLPIGRMARNTTNPILDNTNSSVLTQRRARSPAPKANATSRVLTGSSLPTSTEPASYPPLCLSEPLSGTTPSTAPGGSAKSSNPLTPPTVTSYDSLTIQVPP